MKLIYKARDVTEAHIVSGMLEANGVDSYVGGYYLQGGVGDLAAMDFATVNVDDNDVDAALYLVSEYDKNTIKNGVDESVEKNVFIIPAVIIVFFILMLLLLSVVFGAKY